MVEQEFKIGDIVRFKKERQKDSFGGKLAKATIIAPNGHTSQSEIRISNFQFTVPDGQKGYVTEYNVRKNYMELSCNPTKPIYSLW